MDHNPVEVLILGGGGLAQEVAWVMDRCNAVHPQYIPLGYCDDDPAKHGQSLHGYPILGSLESVVESMKTAPYYIGGIGDNVHRKSIVDRANALGLKPISVVDPSVITAPNAEVGPGSYIAAGCILSPNGKIGAHVIVNQHCTIGHDSHIGDFAQVCPGGRVSGASVLEEGAFIGSNGVVAPGVRLGAWSVLSAAAFALKDTPPGTTSLGAPARVLYRNSKST